MKKKTLSVVALLLAVIMVAVCCAACGEDEKNTAPTTPSENGTSATDAPTEVPTDAPVVPTADSLVGRWKSVFSLVDFMKPTMQNGADMPQEQLDLLYKLYEGLEIPLIFEFKSDAACSLSAEEGYSDTLLEKLKANIRNHIDEILEMGNLTEKDLEQYGYTRETYADLFASQIGTGADFFPEMKGTYSLDGNKLYITGENQQHDPENYVEIELTATTMTIVNASELNKAKSELFAEEVLPLVFNRI